MGAGFSVCHCKSAHVTSPGKTTLQSLNQPDRGTSATGVSHDAFFKVGKSPSVPAPSPKTSGVKKNNSYKPQRMANHISPERKLKEHNYNSTSSSSIENPTFDKHKKSVFPTDADLTSSDSALVIDLTEETPRPQPERLSQTEDQGDLPSRAARPKSAAPRRHLRRSARRQRDPGIELNGVEKASPDLGHVPPFRRFRPKSARDPRRRTRQVMGSDRGQSSSLSRSLSMPSHQQLKLKLKRSDGESSELSDDSADSGKDEEEGFSSSDTLSIPDETDPTNGSSVTTITVKPQLFGRDTARSGRRSKTVNKQREHDNTEIKGGVWERSSHTKSAPISSSTVKDNNNNNNCINNNNKARSVVNLNGASTTDENGSDEGNNISKSNSYNNFYTSSYHSSACEGEERLPRGGISKKASERSISGVILLTPCELPDLVPAHITTTTTPQPSGQHQPHLYPSPNPTPRSPATIKLTPVMSSSSPSTLPLPPSTPTPPSPPSTPLIDSSCPPNSEVNSRPSSHFSPPHPLDTNSVCSVCLRLSPASDTNTKSCVPIETCACTSVTNGMNKENSRTSQHAVLTELEHKASRRRDTSCKTIASRPDSGIAGSSSASYASSEAALLDGKQRLSQADLHASSLEMLEHVDQIQTEGHPTVSNLVKAVTVNCHSAQTKAHAIYRWLSGQSLVYYKCAVCSNPSSPTAKMKQVAEGKITHAALYQEMARCAGLRCELIEGHVKGVNYYPGSPALCLATQHTWNAVSLNGHYALLDAQMGSLPHKFFLEHFFMTPPDEFCLSHFPRDKRWLLMTRAISQQDFFGALKTWPTMFAFNIRPLSMRSVIRTYDSRLSVTVLLRSVAVTPVLEYTGPGPELDGDVLSLGIDQEIRNTDNAETFHMCLPQEGDYFFTLMVHDVEEDEDIPVFQYKIEYNDELL